MSQSMTRRSFGAAAAGLSLTAIANSEQPPKVDSPASSSSPSPTAMPYERDYAPPEFKPSWKKQQINRTLVQDFVIFAHSDLEMTKKLLEKQPALVNAVIDWGAGDWESGLGGASHMGRADIVQFLLASGARIDIFCAAMLGQLDAVKSLLALEPKLIDAKGPHGFSLHFHAQVGGAEAAPVLEYLQSLKTIELKPVPFKRTDGPRKPE